MPIAELTDGRRVPFTLKRRGRDPFYLCCFRGPRGRRLERSTKATNQKGAETSGIAIVREVYSQPERRHQLGWDDAVNVMVRHMEGCNLRPGSIDQYRLAIRNLRKVFPKTTGPHEITAVMAEEFKVRRIEAGLAERTVVGNLTNLSIIFGRWFRDTCKILDSDPFAEVELPKQDKPAARILATAERDQFHEWLAKRWRGWRLPLLFLDVKAAIGCRISELAELRSTSLVEGRVVFVAQTTKGRKQRAPKLPAALFQELESVAGPTYVFERFSDELRRILEARGLEHVGRGVKTYKPLRLIRWLQRQTRRYVRKTGVKRFKLHNLRGTAMSKAREAGIGCDDAAIAFGCNPETMRRHYIAIDEQAISDSVFDRLQAGEI